MSFETNAQLFDVVGTGYVAEHHAEEKYRHLLEAEKNAVGGAMAWLAFYAIALWSSSLTASTRQPMLWWPLRIRCSEASKTCIL